MPRIVVAGVPPWVDHNRLLDDGEWASEDGSWVGERTVTEAADLCARLRNLGLGGHPIEVHVRPPLKRSAVRRARTEEARRMRETTPGFLRSGARLDADGRMFLTPEKLAHALGRRARAARVVDATCGCGGNTIGFARAGAQVVAIDRDRKRLELARHNARLYGVSERITFVHGDATEVVPEHQADLLFVDPPWGEVDRIRMTELPLLDAILAAGRHYPRVWAKVPPSFAGRTGFDLEAWFGHGTGDTRRVKFLLMTSAQSEHAE